MKSRTGAYRPRSGSQWRYSSQSIRSRRRTPAGVVDEPPSPRPPAAGEPLRRAGPGGRPSAGSGPSRAGTKSVVVDQDPHRPLLGERLPGDLAVDADVAPDDLDRLAGQADHPLDVGLRRLAREVEDRDLPAPRAAEVEEELLDQHAVAVALDGRRAVELVLAAVRADRPAGPALLVEPEGEPELAVRADQLPVVPSRVGAIEPVGTMYASAANVRKSRMPEAAGRPGTRPSGGRTPDGRIRRGGPRARSGVGRSSRRVSIGSASGRRASRARATAAGPRRLTRRCRRAPRGTPPARSRRCPPASSASCLPFASPGASAFGVMSPP